MIQRIKIDLWPKSVQMYLQGNPLFAFSFFVAFSGPVLRLMNRKGVGVIFFDPQSPCDILGPLAATVRFEEQFSTIGGRATVTVKLQLV